MSSRYILWLTFLDFKNEMYPGKDKEDLCVLVLGSVCEGDGYQHQVWDITPRT